MTEFIYSRVAATGRKGPEVAVAPGRAWHRHPTTTTTGQLLIVRFGALYTSDVSAGPGSEPGPTERGWLREADHMPLTRT